MTPAWGEGFVPPSPAGRVIWYAPQQTPPCPRCSPGAGSSRRSLQQTRSTSSSWRAVWRPALRPLPRYARCAACTLLGTLSTGRVWHSTVEGQHPCASLFLRSAGAARAPLARHQARFQKRQTTGDPSESPWLQAKEESVEAAEKAREAAVAPLREEVGRLQVRSRGLKAATCSLVGSAAGNRSTQHAGHRSCHARGGGGKSMQSQQPDYMCSTAWRPNRCILLQLLDPQLGGARDREQGACSRRESGGHCGAVGGPVGILSTAPWLLQARVKELQRQYSTEVAEMEGSSVRQVRAHVRAGCTGPPDRPGWRAAFRPRAAPCSMWGNSFPGVDV